MNDSDKQAAAPSVAPDEASAEGRHDGARGDDDRRPREIGGPKGPEPTRYGDWERNGRCSDF